MITNYEYEEYFYTGSHRKCLLFVEQDCNVTIAAGKPPVVTKAEGTPLIITNENILKERFELQENFNSSENWAFGSVEPSVISFDIKEDGTIPILEGKILRLYLYFDGNSSTLMYVGTYTIDEDELSDDSSSRTISGYDFAQSLRDIDIIDWYRTMFGAHEEPDPEDPEQTIWVPAKEKIKVKDARDGLFIYLADTENGEGLPIKQETTELPNDNFEFAFDVDTEALSAGQFIEDICEINGRYGHFGRKLSTASATKNYAVFQYIKVERYDEAGEKIANDMRINGVMKGLYETASIGRLRVYNRDSVLLAYYDEGYKKHFSKYNIYDNLLIDDLTKSKTTKADLKQMMMNIYDSIRYRKYVPFKAKAPADLCREVGDRITLYSDVAIITEEGKTKSFKTLIFTRKISGIQNMVDTYSAQGDKKLPEFGDYASSGGYSATGGRNAKNSNKDKESSDGEYYFEGITADDFIKYLHNIGIEMLEEPTKVEVKYVRDANGHHTEIKWKDPPDISTWQPHPCTWEGTVIIRKEGSPPKWRWDGVEKIKNSTTRDAYENTALVDDTIDFNKEYYYGFYPYYTFLDDDDHPQRRYTFTKIYKVSTYAPLPKPVINSITIDGTYATLNYTIEDWPGGDYTSCMVLAKKGSIPLSEADYDKKVDVSKGTGDANFIGLDEHSRYYFVIYTTDGTGVWAVSDPVDKKTGEKPPIDPELVDMINGDGFFWKDWNASIVYGTYDTTMTWNGGGNYKSYTWVTANGDPITTSDYKTTTGGVAIAAVGAKQTLFINKTTNGYTGTISLGSRISNQWKGSASTRWQDARFAYKNGTTQWSDWPDGSVSTPSSLSYSAETINGVLEYFAKRLRNIYIAVDDNTLYDMAKTHSMTNVQGYVTSSIDESSVNNLSSYFGTDRILRIEHSSWQSSYIRSFDGYIAGCDATNGMVFTYSYIPINRTKVKSIRFKAAVPTQYGQQNAMIQVKTAYFSGNTMTPNAGSASWNPDWQGTWQEYVLSYTDPVNVDYIQIKTGYNDWYIKDMVIYTEG